MRYLSEAGKPVLLSCFSLELEVCQWEFCQSDGGEVSVLPVKIIGSNLGVFLMANDNWESSLRPALTPANLPENEDNVM